MTCQAQDQAQEMKRRIVAQSWTLPFRNSCQIIITGQIKELHTEAFQFLACQILKSSQCISFTLKQDHIICWFYLFFKNYLFIIFGCAESSLLWVGFSSPQLLLLQSMGHRDQGLPQLWQHRGSVAPGHVGSSQTRDQTGVPCIARQILNHWTTREALFQFFQFSSFSGLLVLN